MRNRLIAIAVLLIAAGDALANPSENLAGYSRLMNGCRAAMLEDQNILGSLIQSGKTIETVCSCASAAFFSSRGKTQRRVLAAKGLKPTDLGPFMEMTRACMSIAR